MKRLAPVMTVVLVAGLALGAYLVRTNLSHAASGPIIITSDTDFTTCGCVSSGNGSMARPYVIGPLTINNVNGAAVTIDGTTLTKSFELLNLTIAGNSTSTDTGIVLNHINPGGVQSISASVYGKLTSIQTNNVGILVENSHYVTLVFPHQ